DPALTYQITAGSLASGDAFTGALTREAGEDVSSYAIKQGTLALNSNYDLTFVGANLTITKHAASVTADDKTKVYGQDNPALTATVSGSVGSDVLSYTLATTATASSGVGDYAIAVTLGANANYDVSKTDGTLSITKKAASVTADDKTKVYGQDNPALTATVSGSVGSDVLSYTLATTATASSGVGDYPIAVTLGANPNYDVTSTNGTLAITKRSVTATADAKT